MNFIKLEFNIGGQKIQGSNLDYTIESLPNISSSSILFYLSLRYSLFYSIFAANFIQFHRLSDHVFPSIFALEFVFSCPCQMILVS